MANDLVHVLREQADSVTVGIDPADVLAGGRRRLVRRRVVAGAAALTVAATALAGAAFLGPGTRERTAPIATQSTETPSYSTGSILILGDDVVEARGPVTSFVRVPAGTAYTTGEGTVRLLRPGHSEALTIGRTTADAPHLVADPAHDRVAWVSDSSGAPAFVVYDVRRDSQRTSYPETNGTGDAADQAHVYALDGDALYASDARGAVRIDLADDRATVLRLAASARTIGAATGGKVAWLSPVRSQGYVVGDRFGDGVPMGRHDRPLLSVGGTYLSTDDDAGVHVQRTNDASVVTPTLPSSYTRVIAYGWSDDDHLLVAGVTSRLDGKRVVDLVFLTCSIAGGDCRETGEGHSYPATLNLPVGEPALPLAEALRRQRADSSAAMSVRAARDS